MKASWLCRETHKGFAQPSTVVCHCGPLHMKTRKIKHGVERGVERGVDRGVDHRGSDYTYVLIILVLIVLVLQMQRTVIT
jgi:hypothetical protein